MSRQSPMLSRRQGQTPNMVAQRKLPPGPGPLNREGKKFSYRIKSSSSKSNITSNGPVKAVHTDYENSNYLKSRASSPVGSYPLSYSKALTAADSRRDLSASSLRNGSNISSSLYDKSIFGNVKNTLEKSRVSLLSPTERTSSSTPIGGKSNSTYNGIQDRNSHSKVLPESSGTNTLLTRKSSFRNSGYQSTYSFSRERSQSLSTMYGEGSRSSSRVRRGSESDNSFSNRSSSLPTNHAFVGSGFGQVNKDLRGRIGLTNIGNTCFMNSVLQCLGNCNLLQDYIIKENYILDINDSSSRTKGKLIKAFAYVMKNLWAPETSTRTSFSPKKFKECLDSYFDQYRGARQHDSQEFLRYLLEALHDDTNSVKRRPKYIKIEDNLSEEEKAKKAWNIYLGRESSFISNLFVGQLKSILECSECQNCSVTFDPFWDLSLPIPRNKRDATLIDCLKEFTKQEVLEGEERPMCSKCKMKRKCLKSFSIQRFPKILVIHLKRFSGYSKLSNFVDFPVSNLDLGPFASKSCNTPHRYDLIATSNHSGFTYGGHYIAHAKHTIQKKWYCYDDTRVDEVSDTSIKSSQAYVLFYQQTGTPARL
ncbi:ubiquitin carboxyl-terminal hydrolase 2-like [Anneissia japonica]|uniref:ubiquitin carboxyl-terminal hydrolase 2-like n=1 Tax=Anneissia japonica TaxID=1529436 RepID=UPI001425AC8D|nr:ubiquitin carboxyl-terminal hydrolase 2-like [Anneissia japonica]